MRLGKSAPSKAESISVDKINAFKFYENISLIKEFRVAGKNCRYRKNP
jgi:hypothetical protein